MTRIVAYRFKVVLFGATSSPYLLNQTMQYHLDSQSSRLASTLKTSFYIDNFQGCYVDPKDILCERPLIQALMLKANMPLAIWTNNAHLKSNFTKIGIHDYLGLEWDTVNDTLNVKLPPELEISHSHINTKRKVKSLISSIYDPIGLIFPLTILGKLFIQKLWMTDKGWDTPIDPEQVQELTDIIKRYKGLEKIKVPRNVHDGSQPAMHICADASNLTFGLAVYIVTQEGNSRLLTAKAQVTPKCMLEMDESLTFPKLELTALLLGCRLAKHLSELCPGIYASVTVWSDASTALQWVHNSKSNSFTSLTVWRR
ncbi:uncharacterized protein [Palaemon carinicauda]|uniref:uncharacterized protein n=1 Tax=Palaemon carinicauda TaxID=392227 RepID=UPI0035B5DCD9